MESTRHNLRIKGDSHCLLTTCNGITYHARLVNLSLSGALVDIDNNISYDLHLEDTCELTLSETPNTSSTKFTGIIVRLESDVVGISFTHQ
ncbi:MAG: PilZ domain-containing protein [Proteobacteria bacterium]|nr:PilZ domain-containing protein [Pseudomonadota bacterium]